MFTFFEVIKTLILPPAILIILLIVGLCCWKKRSLSFLIIVFATVIFYLLSLSPVALTLAKYLQYYPALNDDTIARSHAQAIVVLSGGRYAAPEYDRDVANEGELMRLEYAAYLYRKTHLPILVSGGYCGSKRSSEAQVMADVLQREFQVPVKWIENQSEDTWQNAKYSIAILKAHGLQKAFVVTTAVHIPRSVLAFQHFGFDVVAAPTRFFTLKNPKMNWMDLIPNGEALHCSKICLYEYFGLVWYKTRISLHKNNFIVS